MQTHRALADDATVVQRILDHIDRKTTDLGDGTWREPVANYRSPARFAAEIERVMRRSPAAFCPSAALPEVGSWVAREAAGTPLLAVRGSDGRVRAFRNACRHRGMQLAAGAGCARSFVCRYHGWTYGLDGSLRHVPGEHGFPGLDKAARGLTAVDARERQGIVFVTQDAAPGAEEALATLPPLIPASYRLLDASERDVPANWKIVVEGFLEGYHIRSTHPSTFYPIQYDNLNVVERFGCNNRVAFPYQAVEKLRGAPPEARHTDGKLTYVYHLFPNGIVATFPGRIVMVALEPLALDRTRFVTYVLSDRDASDAQAGERLKRGGDLVDLGA
ncbi:MAG TPA: aromatic ring-hydroxylating dioxygenase subunit alpha, partial [Myxococcota bacterium]|nr:aromatic ring-hydroxylating dioxygenase subunit alpha [Myxococcota bacterium]